jgi:hypothetical protein
MAQVIFVGHGNRLYCRGRHNYYFAAVGTGYGGYKQQALGSRLLYQYGGFLFVAAYQVHGLVAVAVKAHLFELEKLFSGIVVK